MSEFIYQGESASLAAPCPASIWLLGAPAQCHKTGPHDMHEIVIQWRVG